MVMLGFFFSKSLVNFFKALCEVPVNEYQKLTVVFLLILVGILEELLELLLLFEQALRLATAKTEAPISAIFL